MVDTPAPFPSRWYRLCRRQPAPPSVRLINLLVLGQSLLEKAMRGADWLTRRGRENEESTREMIGALALQTGMVVADVGCGNGYHALMMAPLVGVEGRVLCVDIQKEMLVLLSERADELRITNHEMILGSSTSPNLPKNAVDLILLVDAYHEFTNPGSMLRGMRESLAPGGV